MLELINGWWTAEHYFTVGCALTLTIFTIGGMTIAIHGDGYNEGDIVGATFVAGLLLFFGWGVILAVALAFLPGYAAGRLWKRFYGSA